MKEHHCTSIVPLFNHLSEEEQDKIESLVIHRHFSKGETVWQPGDDPLPHSFIISFNRLISPMRYFAPGLFLFNILTCTGH